MRQSVAVMNFHELSARLVEAHHKAIGLDPGYSMPVKAWQRKTMATLTSDKREVSAALELLGTLKREAISDQDLLERVATAGNRVALAYERRRQEEQYIDYADLLRYAQLILRNPRVAALFQDHFDAVLVDEFQDLSLQQYELTRLIGSRNTMFVGDPYQGIFGWAGAEPEAVYADLKSRVEQTIELDVSFRSSPAVLKVVNSISKTLGSAGLESANPNEWVAGGHAYAAGYDTDASEALGIVALTDYLAAQYPEDRIGVICRASYRRGAPLNGRTTGQLRFPSFGTSPSTLRASEGSFECTRVRLTSLHRSKTSYMTFVTAWLPLSTRQISKRLGKSVKRAISWPSMTSRARQLGCLLSESVTSSR